LKNCPRKFKEARIGNPVEKNMDAAGIEPVTLR
jgi:hypothetical protein